MSEVKALLHIQLAFSELVIKPAHGIGGVALAAQLVLAVKAEEPRRGESSRRGMFKSGLARGQKQPAELLSWATQLARLQKAKACTT